MRLCRGRILTGWTGPAVVALVWLVVPAAAQAEFGSGWPENSFATPKAKPQAPAPQKPRARPSQSERDAQAKPRPRTDEGGQKELEGRNGAKSAASPAAHTPIPTPVLTGPAPGTPVVATPERRELAAPVAAPPSSAGPATPAAPVATEPVEAVQSAGSPPSLGARPPESKPEGAPAALSVESVARPPGTLPEASAEPAPKAREPAAAPPPPVAVPAVVPATSPPSERVQATASPQQPARGTPWTEAVERGADLWLQARGARGAAADGCDLGAGPARIDGALAQLPRYFADAGRVQDVEARVLWCWGIASTAAAGSSRDLDADLRAVTAYLATHSAGERRAPPHDHVAEHQARALGERFFFRRQGPLDHSCASCHGGAPTGGITPTRVSTGTSAALTPQLEAAAATATADRVETLASRIRACLRRMGLPQPRIGSDVVVALTSYLSGISKDGVVKVPKAAP